MGNAGITRTVEFAAPPAANASNPPASGEAAVASSKGPASRAAGRSTASSGAARPGAASATKRTASAAKSRGASSPTTGRPSGKHADPASSCPIKINGPALLESATNGNADAFIAYRAADPLLRGPLLEERDYAGRSVLHLAAWHGHCHVLHELLRPLSGAAPAMDWAKHVTRAGNTVLHTAAQAGRTDALQLLVQQRNAHVMASTRNRRNETPQEAAVTYNQTAAAQPLMRFHGAELRPVAL
jgi:hypothetical protein